MGRRVPSVWLLLATGSTFNFLPSATRPSLPPGRYRTAQRQEEYTQSWLLRAQSPSQVGPLFVPGIRPQRLAHLLQVRVRPPTSWEGARLPQQTYDNCIRTDGALSTPAKSTATNAPLREVIQIVDDRVLTFDPDEKDPSRAFVERGFVPPGTKRYKDRRFIFDRVFDYQARQQDVYHGTAKPLLSNLLEGYNATIFAYGVSLNCPSYSGRLLNMTTFIRLQVVVKHTLLAVQMPILVSSTSQWPTSSNKLKTKGRKISLT